MPRPGTLGADPLAAPGRPRTPLSDAASRRGGGPLPVDSTLPGPVSFGLITAMARASLAPASRTGTRGGAGVLSVGANAERPAAPRSRKARAHTRGPQRARLRAGVWFLAATFDLCDPRRSENHRRISAAWHVSPTHIRSRRGSEPRRIRRRGFEGRASFPGRGAGAGTQRPRFASAPPRTGSSNDATNHEPRFTCVGRNSPWESRNRRFYRFVKVFIDAAR
jgi:hypothetical protein